MRLAFAFLLCALAAGAQTLDGHWAGEATGSGKGGVREFSFTLDLRVQGGALTGQVTPAGRKKASGLAIQEGKLDGSRFSFTTVQKGKKGDATFYWQGKIVGDQITGNRMRDGARRGQSFIARRSPAL